MTFSKTPARTIYRRKPVKKARQTDNLKQTPGRPGYWRPEMANQIYQLTMLGYTDKQLAQFYGVGGDVIIYWKNNNEAFRYARQRGGAEADMEVVMSLHKRAVGFSYVEKTSITNKEGKIVRTETVTKVMPGDVHAALKWLQMRQREKWGDKHDISITVGGNVDHRFVAEHLKNKELYSTEELENLLDLAMQKTQLALAEDAEIVEEEE